MTDYMSAVVGMFHPDSAAVSVLPVSGVHTDVALRSYAGLIYVIERFGKDAVTVLDPATPALPRANYSTGNGTNPQDIVVASATKAYVLRLNSANILIINPQTGDSVGTIDLASYADAADGKPEMAGGVLDDETLYVIVQLLDTATSPWSWPPTGLGKVLAIDTKTNTVSRTFTLTIKNPVAIAKHDNALYVVGGPYDDITTTGVDRVALPAGTATRLANGATLGGRPTALEITEQNNAGWVLVAQAWPSAKVYKMSLTSGSVIDSLAAPQSPSAIVVGMDTVLLVSDRAMAAPGLYVYNALTGTKRRGPIATALPPDALVFVKD
jgi:DNA-binding beta-propeller fold protein YncE